MRLLDKKAFVDFITTLWNIWNYRNNAIFRGKEEDARAPKTCKWDVIKLNVDASMKANRTSLGIIVRDLDGFVLSGKAVFINRVVNSEWAELDAFLEGIWLAQSLNLDKVIFETNYACIVNHFCKHKDDITIFGYHIKEARNMLDSCSKVEVKWVDRGCNKV
ncbi:hypothetical protein Gotri_023193, partial [Gossypium trilobum]|nr:hypothetical protein [Gossypium trilobum]